MLIDAPTHPRPSVPLVSRDDRSWAGTGLFTEGGCRALGGGEGPRGYPWEGEMGSPSPPQAPIFLAFFFARIFTCFYGNSAYLRPCYHALRQPFGAADRAMLLN